MVASPPAPPTPRPVARTGRELWFAAEDALASFAVSTVSAPSPASTSPPSTSTSSPRRPGASTRSTTSPAHGHVQDTRRGQRVRAVLRGPRKAAVQRTGFPKRGATTALDAEPEDPSSSSGHRGTDESRPTVVVREAATQSMALAPPQLSVLLVAAGTGDFLDRDQHAISQSRRRPFSKLPPPRGGRAGT